MSLLTAGWLKTPTHAASLLISLPIALFLQPAAEIEMARLHKTAQLTLWQVHLMTSTPSYYGVTQNIQLVSRSTLILLGTYFRIPVSSRSFDHRTASRILLDMVNNGTFYFKKRFYRKGIRNNRRTRNKKKQKKAEKKSPRVV